MLEIKNLTEITSNGICIGCGLCQSVVGKEKIHISMTDKGRLEPKETVSLSNEEFKKIKEICPGLFVEGLPKKEIKKNSKEDLIWDFITLYYMHGHLIKISDFKVQQGGF